MLNELIPQFMVSRFDEITPVWLASKGLLGVAVDLDNTLAKYSQDAPSQDAFDWVKQLKSAGIAAGIVSNNKDMERVKKHAEALGLPFIAPAGKPRPDGLLKLCRVLGLPPNKCAMVGDQIYTDCRAARRAGMAPVLVRPLSGSVFVRIRMLAELPFICIAKRRSS